MPEELTFQTAIKEFPIESMNVLFKPVEFTTSELAWAALQWLFARNMMNGIRWIPWVKIGPGHRDALRWVLEQVRDRLKQEREAADAK